MSQLANILECGMLISFGLAWPANIRNSLKIKTARGRSVHFLIIVIIGYLFGLGAKIAASNVNYVALFYLINLLMVSFDLSLYYHYRRLDYKKTGR
ncbi:MAG: hypothetical protein LBT47_05975 [Deltaproteobacteria bacterium]|jgi:hypothetical protein|nr:hypothetical protein [Deltaproteobacteria bacterium]